MPLRATASPVLLGALCLCAPHWASAADGTGGRVLLVERGRDPFLERVGAELEELGFSLVRRNAGGPLEVSAREQDAVAAIRVLPSRKGVEVWMADATSGRSLLRHVVVDERPGGPDRDLVALQTAELLRTSLLQEGSASEPSERSAHPLDQETSPEPIQPASSALQAAFGSLYSPGGVSAAAELGVSFYHSFDEPWGLALDVGLPFRSGTISGVEGSATLSAYFAGAALQSRFRYADSPFFAAAAVGGAFVFIEYDGEAREPLRSTSGTQSTAAAYMRGDAGVEAARWLRVGFRALAGASVQRITVKFAGNDAGSFGPIYFAGFAFAEVPLL